MAEDSSSDGGYFQSYDDPGVHRLMISDHARTDAYRRAIEEVVESGASVLDVGTGTGILSLFAARAGASVVWAIDESAIVEVARRVSETNNVSSRVHFLRGRAEEVEMPEPVDVIVSEWMGFFALAECMFLSVIDVRDRHLAPGGVVIPSNIGLTLVPVDDSNLHVDRGVGLWERPVYGFDFSDLIEHELKNLITTAVDLKPSSFLGEPVELVNIDCLSGSVDDFFFTARTELCIERTGSVHGFGGWFDAQLSPSVCLSTSPFSPQTHWRQSFFPVRPFTVHRGDRLILEVKARPKEFGDRRLPLYFFEGSLQRQGEEQYSFFYCHQGSFE